MTNILNPITTVGLMAEQWGSHYKYHKKDNHFQLLSLFKKKIITALIIYIIINIKS